MLEPIIQIYRSIKKPQVYFVLGLCFLACLPAKSQSANFWVPSDTLNKKRFWLVTGGGAIAYTGASIGLYEIWYKNFERGPFRTFDDWGEWENMDKWGHLMTAYTESYLAYKGARWTGLPQKKAALVGAGVGTLLQTTVEVMDGFSARWGFSWHDVAFNTAGSAIFLSQELIWEEQRLLIKVSSTRPKYSEMPITDPRSGLTASPKEAAFDLYGSNFFEYLLKDYNAMTIWASINPHSFLGKNAESSSFPAWLNLAVGIGADGVYGAYGNAWTAPDGRVLNLRQFPRQRQYYLSLDIDTGRIKTKHPFLKTVFSVVRWVKIPAPTLEWDGGRQFKFHPIYW